MQKNKQVTHVEPTPKLRPTISTSINYNLLQVYNIINVFNGIKLLVYVNCAFSFRRQHKLYNKELYADFIAAQIKTLSFLAYIIRIYQVHLFDAHLLQSH